MRFIKNILANSPLSLVLVVVFLLSGCAGYTIPDEDGIYAQNKRRTNQETRQAHRNSKTENNEYAEYFAKQNAEITQAEKYMFGQEDEVFTDIEDYSSGSAGNADTYINAGENYYGEFSNSPEMEYTKGQPSWGSNPSTININYYGSPFYTNPYLYRGFYRPWGWGGYYDPWGYYPSSYWGRGYLGYGFGYGLHLGFGFGGFYSPYYRPYYPYGYGGYYGGYYGNPYYAYSRPRSYHYGRRGYRSSPRNVTENSSRRVGTRSARSQNNRRAIRSSENTRRSARTTATRRSQSARNNSRATSSRRGNTNSSYNRRIKNPKNIRAGSSRRSVRSTRSTNHSVGREGTRRSSRSSINNNSRSNSSSRVQRSRRTSTRVHSSPTRRSSNTSIHRSSSSRSSGGSRSGGGGSRRR